MKKLKFIITFILINVLFLSLSSCKNNNEIIDLLNNVNDTALKSNVRIISSFAQSRAASIEATKTGSGVIIKHADSDYYVITNNHNIYYVSNYKTFKVVDCYQNQYEATLVTNSDLATYDLALLKFSTKNDLNVIDIDTNYPNNGDTVVSIGEQLKKSNIVTFGKYLGLTSYIHPDGYNENENNIQFDVIKHNCYIESGNSGGMLINTSMKLIGINFSSGYLNDEFLYGYSIPSSKILEYLDELNFILN